MRLMALLLVLSLSSAASFGQDKPTELPQVAANDNRAPAGELRNGVLAIGLVIAKGEWRPGIYGGKAIPVYAFGEEGKPLENPGPLIRVPQGTTIHATVHNQLRVAATVYGLSARPSGGKGDFTVQPNESREVTFNAGQPGTYYYMGETEKPVATPSRATDCTFTLNCGVARRELIDTQLHGALIVDPPGAAGDDRIFVISVWDDQQLATVFRGVAAINGKTWPYTERLTLKAGEPAHWRVLDVRKRARHASAWLPLPHRCDRGQ